MDSIPVFYNEVSFSYKDKIVGISSHKKDKKILKKIIESFKKFSTLYQFIIYVTSSQTLVNRNTSILKKDLMQLPFISSDEFLSSFDFNIAKDVNNYAQEFIRKGENSIVLKKIDNIKFESVLNEFGNHFCDALNQVYNSNKSKFRLSDVVLLKGLFIATIFKYDNIVKKASFQYNIPSPNLQHLLSIDLSKHLSSNRIVKIYPTKDTIILIKPNQLRYWLSLAAYRDADKCFADLSQLGY